MKKIADMFSPDSDDPKVQWGRLYEKVIGISTMLETFRSDLLRQDSMMGLLKEKLDQVNGKVLVLEDVVHRRRENEDTTAKQLFELLKKRDEDLSKNNELTWKFVGKVAAICTTLVGAIVVVINYLTKN